jgi:hypothetical protein
MEDSRQQPSSNAKYSSSHASGPPRPTKLPTNIIQPSAFIDTLAIQALFLHMPLLAMLGIHGLFIASSLSGVPMNSTRSIFGWSANTKGSSATAPTSAVSRIVLKAIAIDFAVAIVTLYVTPLLRRVVVIFAHSIVAAALGGGPKVFTNAIYATTIVEFIRLLWEKLSYYLFSDDNDFMMSSLPHHHNPQSYYHSDPSKSFNTLTSIWAMIPSTIRFVRHMDWVHEFPLIFFQVVAVHVIGLGLLPYIRKVFPDRSDLKNIADEESIHSESFIDNSLLSGNGALTSGFNVSEPPTDINLLRGGLTELSVSGKGSAEAASAQSLNTMNPNTDFDFLYAPSSVKKNKRLAIVRANQPLWSTLASSIVLAARHETEDAAALAGAGGELEKASGIGGSVLNEVGHCYVRYIFENVVAFETVGFDPSLRSSFSVHVNGILWPQVSIQSFIDEPTDRPASKEDPFLVIVYGLTPMTQYDIEILCAYKAASSPLTCLKICVSTISGKNTDTNGPAGTTPARPLSPVTTLLDTLTTTQMTLSEEKSSLKRLRKDHTKRLTSLRQEIDSMRSKIDSTDKNDERNRRKVLSLREAVRQIEEEIESINRVAESLSLKEQQVDEEFNLKEREWKEHMGEFEERQKQEQDIHRSLNQASSEMEDQLSSLVSK